MTKTLYDQFKDSLIKAAKNVGINNDNPQIELPKPGFKGNFSTTIALASAKELKKNPREVAELIKNELLKEDYIEDIEIAGPGFINVLFKPEFISSVVKNVSVDGKQYGSSEAKDYVIDLEEVSANPTGYLHVGHARNAVLSDSLVRIFRFNGYTVKTEYYINDAGNQINVLAVTVFVYYLNALGIKTELPEESYKGDGYEIVAQKLIEEYGDKFKDVKFDGEKHLILDPEVHEIFKTKSTQYFLDIIKQQLKDLDVEIETYESEKKVYEDNMIPKVLEEYKEKNATYEKDGALWLKTTDFGDDKDRVLVKSDGAYTYLTPDLATHHERIKRVHANKLINVWGGDHHGYITRMKAGLELLGDPADSLEILMVQMVRVIKDGKEYKMSKRAGTAVWLIDLLDIVGKDALRYMLASKSGSTHMDLDLDVIKAKDSSNPVYYAQYATARMNSILRQAQAMGLEINNDPSNKLTTDKEVEILITLDNFKRTVDAAANTREPHIITDYIQTLSKLFHSYYAETKVIDDSDLELTAARLGLVQATLQVFKNALSLIGVEALEQM